MVLGIEDAVPFRQDPDETRRLLLEAAAAEFLEKGYAGTSFASIAARLEITKGAFSYHFPTKASLVEAVFARFAQVLRLADRSAYEAFPDGGLRGLVVFLLESRDAVLEDPVAAAASPLFVDRATVSIAAPTEIEDWVTIFTEFFDEAEALGEVDLVVDSKTAAEFVIATQTGSSVYFRRYPGHADQDVVGDLQLALRGVGVEDPATPVEEAMEAMAARRDT